MDEKLDLKRDKYIGAFLGAAVGDALGWPNEQNSKNTSLKSPKEKEMFQKWIRRDGYRGWSHYEEINPGEYSDDTQLLIATARSLQYGSNWSKYFSRIELPAWISYERGGGGATKRAANSWKGDNSPWTINQGNITNMKRYFNAGGNGVAMRILPHVFANEDNSKEIMYQTILNGISTHGHPRALIGATLYADALIYLSNITETLKYGELIEYLLDRENKWGKFPNIKNMNKWMANADKVFNISYMNVWNSVVDETIDLLNIAKEGLDRGALDMGNAVLEDLGCFDKDVNGAGTVTAVAAIYLASKYASSPRLGIVEAAYLKNADTDTLASMVGGLLGMLHGTEFMSVSWHMVQDYEYIIKLINTIGSDVKKEREQRGEVLDYANNKLNIKLKSLKIGESIKVLPFGKLVLQEKRPNKTNSKRSVVHTLKFISEEGQSIFIKTFERANEEQSQQVRPNTEHKIGTLPERQQNISLNTSPNKPQHKPLLDSNKVRSLANILPKKMPSDQCFFLISDIMAEMERSTKGWIDEEALNYLIDSWAKYKISLYEIQRIINVIENR